MQLGVEGPEAAGVGLGEEDDEGADGSVEEGGEEGGEEESDGDEGVEGTVSGAGGIGSGTN